ncbi:hypothetical protein [Shewanella ulleungensis]|uniref:hypothetical protein n=1 Tax=Shewanella ulleungensis TaxID=2282699 RepID=UPI003D7923D6
MNIPAYEDMLADLSMAREKPLLIEVQRKTIDNLHQNINGFSLLKTYRNQFDLDANGMPLNDKKVTNIIYIDANTDNKSQLLNSIYLAIGDQLKNKLRIDALLKLASVAGSDVFGDLILEPVGDLFSYSKDFFKDNLWDSDLIKSASEWIKDLSKETIEEKVGDYTESKGKEFAINQINCSKLYLTADSEEKLLELASSLSSKETAHQIMEYTYELLSSLSLGAPKLIVVNNPQYLDSASISILSILFSFAKDKKQEHDILGANKSEAFNGLSVVFQFTDDTVDEKSETCQCLRRLRNMVQRYGMLERIGSTIPLTAIRSTTFVGRARELQELSINHYAFIEQIPRKYNKKNDKASSQWTLIKGEAGVGKTALINQHLKLLAISENAPSNQIRLRLLNQVGHSSELTGLVSLQHSINKELKRLINDYQLNHSIFTRTIKNKILSSQQDFQILKNKAVSWSRKLDKTSEYVASSLGYSGIHKAIKSGYQSTKLNDEVLRAQDTLEEKNNHNNKQKEFDYLDEGLELLHLVSNMHSSNSLPTLLFVDDLQWIDELSSQYIINRFIVNYPSEILFTTRESDSISLLKGIHNHRPYTSLIFDKINLIQSEIISNETLSVDKLLDVTLRNVIDIDGLNQDNLSELIKKTFLNTSDENAMVISSYIISALSTESKNETSNINTLFAIESLNLISDKNFYVDGLKQIEPIFSELKKGVYFFNVKNNDNLKFNLKLIFDHLNNVYSNSYRQNAKIINNSHSFTLTSYAVMEERIMLIQKYFAENGDVVVFALQFSVLLGKPFDSEQIRYLITELSDIKETDNNPLTPIRDYILKMSSQQIHTEHFDLLEEAFEILRRLDDVNKYKYKHSLYEIFLTQQIESNLYAIFKSNIESIHHFLRYCVQLLDNKYGSNINTLEKSHINDSQLHISIFGFNLHPEIWSSEVSDRLFSYGSFKTGNTLARATSYLKMIDIIPLHEKLIKFLNLET